VASHSAQTQIMRPARMFPGIGERKLAWCGEPKLSPAWAKGATMNASGKRKTLRGSQLSGVAVLAVTCTVLGACGSSGSTGSASPPAASSDPATNGNASTPTRNGSALEGTWRTGNVTLADFAAKLRQLGLQKWIQPFRAKAEWPQVLGQSNVFLLTIAGGAWHEGWSKDGGPFTDQDDGIYRIVGNTVLVTPTCCPAEVDTWRWSVQGDTLRLTRAGVKNGGSFQGIPGEVFQVFYDVAPFRRQP